ncbi:MAG: 3-hydroxyacyl-CoA dehydrogenase NAD-binding domain-containing protein [Microbacterium sp.]
MTQDLQASIVGLGTMGRSIARLLMTAGIRTIGFDPEAGDIPGLHRADSVEACVAEADVVFEAVFEDADVKAETLRRISDATSGTIASNTSTFIPSVLAPHVSDPGRFLVGHFFNPADLIPLVEVVPHPGTRPEVADDFVALMRRLGRRPVVLQAERTGFVANRLQAAILRESLSLVEQGVVTAADLDEVVISGLAARWAAVGPIGVADLGGLDIFRAVCTQIFPTLDDASEPSALLVEQVARGDLGAKTGSGFYPHTAESTAAAQAAVSRILRVQRETRSEEPTPAG